MAERTGKIAILEQMIADGGTYLFGNPGTVEQGLIDAAGQVPGIEYILALQESVAVGMADGYARAARRPAFVQLHSGVGLGNGIGMLYQAYRGHSPLVVISGEAGVRYEAMDAQMACDLVAIARPVTKWAGRVVDRNSVLRILRRAVKMASTPPQGPTFVALSADVLDEPNDEPVVPTSAPSTRVHPERDEVLALAQMLAGARRPLILMGDGVVASGAQAELARVAECVGAEVWGVNDSEVNIDPTHPLYRGKTGHMFGKESNAIVADADAVLVCGTYLFPEVYPSLTNMFRDGARIAHVDLDSYEIAKNFPVHVGIVADPKLTLGALAEALVSAMTPDQVSAAKRRARTLSDGLEERRRRELAADAQARDQTPMRFARFAEAIAGRLPPEALIFDEAITCSGELTRYVRPRAPGQFFQSRGGSLGVAIPGAIGIKLARPDRPVVAFAADGATMYTAQALWTAARYAVDVTFVVCNNGRYHLLDENIEEYWAERGIPRHPYPASFDLTRPPLRFAEIARAHGVRAARVERPEQIAPALDEAFSQKGPFLIDVVVA